MKKLKDWVMVAAFVFVALYFFSQAFRSVEAADLIDRDYPYYIFKDGKDEKGNPYIRYCMQPDGPEDHWTSCWTRGKEQSCEVLPINEGYVRCPGTLE